MTVNTDQAIFDAIAAAVTPVHSFDATRVGLGIDVKKFIDTFNGHRDRKLCTSLDVAQTQSGPLLSRARQFIADAGCDEDDHDVNAARDELLADIDAALNAAQTPNEPVAWTNEAQLGFLREPHYANGGIPMAMWAKQGGAADIPMYRTVAQVPSMNRQQIVDLIRDQYDPAPAHYKLGDNWDDGAERIADAILGPAPTPESP